MKVAPRALLISLSLWERVGVRETIMAPTTDIFRGGVGAMISEKSAITASKRGPSRSTVEAGS